ncbi:short-chain dehydrogenase/reductase [Marimonas sp. MJW-29]|uniref:Short-chain dehydrogenase/reductase n=1 Tax=Sulfitobacter sediminis TaxID=3234186 RepID=A0ABV3RMP2_9RHOB
MDLQLNGKHVLVTGASKGIGRAIALAFSAEGAKLTLAARSQDGLQAVIDEIASLGAEADFIVADLSTEADREKLIAARPDIDILVNNAGAIKAGPATAVTMQDWRDGFELKVWGYIHLTLGFLPKMRARGAGTIINIIGMGGRATRPSYVIGAAGNAALIGFTQAMGATSPDDQVRVFGINPSPTLTDRMVTRFRGEAERELGDAERWEEMVGKVDFPFGRPKSAEEVASLTVMLASPRVHYLSGTVVDMDGGGQWRG